MANDKSAPGKPDRSRVSVNQKHEVDCIMKLGKIDREKVLTLIKWHNGDRDKIYADIANRAKSRS